MSGCDSHDGNINALPVFLSQSTSALSALSCILCIFIKSAQLKCVSKYYPQWHKLVMTL